MKRMQAGPLNVGYEDGFLRRISYGGTEIIRMIYFALRDHNWNTLKHQIENEIISFDDDNFRITYDCLHLEGGMTIMEWKGMVVGNADGSIIFEIHGTALEKFRKNRAGFCVLHPLNVVREECRIVHPDRSETARQFPYEIAADNPFQNVQSITWKTSGSAFSLLFEGDTFETEDQRNWGDASFKTFCTPLVKPFPVELRRGERVFQRITFKPVNRLQPVKAGSTVITLRDSGLRNVMPAIGIGASTEKPKLPEEVISSIRGLRLSHYRIDLTPGSEDFALNFSNEYENAFALGLPLEVVLHLTDNFPEEMEAFTVLSQQNKVRLKKVLLLDRNGMVTTQKVIDQLMPLKGAFPRVLFGGGTNYNFNEINKNRFNSSQLDFVSFSMDPQEHAFDDLTILENSSSLEYLVRSAKAIYGEQMQIHLSPVALRKRFNPYATDPADLFIPESKKADPRQKETFAAVWTFASLCSIARGGASAVTLYQTVGHQGICSPDGKAYPVFDILKHLSPYQGKPVSVLDSSDELSVAGILLDGKMLGMANLSDEEKTVRLNDAEFLLMPKEVKFQPLNRT